MLELAMAAAARHAVPAVFVQQLQYLADLHVGQVTKDATGRIDRTWLRFWQGIPYASVAAEEAGFIESYFPIRPTQTCVRKPKPKFDPAAVLKRLDFSQRSTLTDGGFEQLTKSFVVRFPSGLITATARQPVKNEFSGRG